MTSDAVDFLVRRDDLHATKSVPMTPPGELALSDGEVVVGVDRFAFTANARASGAPACSTRATQPHGATS